jgi:hypothetical protein
MYEPSDHAEWLEDGLYQTNSNTKPYTEANYYHKYYNHEDYKYPEGPTHAPTATQKYSANPTNPK